MIIEFREETGKKSVFVLLSFTGMIQAGYDPTVVAQQGGGQVCKGRKGASDEGRNWKLHMTISDRENSTTNTRCAEHQLETAHTNT